MTWARAARRAPRAGAASGPAERRERDCVGPERPGAKRREREGSGCAPGSARTLEAVHDLVAGHHRVALAWRIAYAVIWKWDQLVTGDAYFYHHQANGLVDGFGFYRFLPHSVQRLVPNGPAADHPPLYPLYLALFSLFGGRSFHVHMIASCLLGAATVFVCGLLGREVAGERAGIVAAVIATVYANLWIQDPLVTSESITMLTVAIAVLLAYKLWRAPSLKRAVWFGLACGLASLTRAEVILFLPLVLIPLVSLEARVDRRLAIARVRGQRRGRGAGDGAVADPQPRRVRPSHSCVGWR